MAGRAPGRLKPNVAFELSGGSNPERVAPLEVGVREGFLPNEGGTAKPFRPLGWNGLFCWEVRAPMRRCSTAATGRDNLPLAWVTPSLPVSR